MENTDILEKYGRWFEKKEKGEWLREKEQGETAIVCSFCGGGFYQERDFPQLQAWMKMNFRYCPFCGARMGTFDDAFDDEEDEEA